MPVDATDSGTQLLNVEVSCVSDVEQCFELVALHEKELAFDADVIQITFGDG